MIILRLNVLPTFPFICFCSRRALKAWYSLITNYWLNWHPVSSNDNKNPRSLKGISIFVSISRSHQWSKVLGYPFPALTWWHTSAPAATCAAPKARRNLSLASKERHHNPFYGTLSRIKGRYDSGFRFLFLTSTWILQESVLSLCRCLSIPVTMDFFFAYISEWK